MQWLLFRDADIDPVDYVEKTLAIFPELIAENLRATQARSLRYLKYFKSHSLRRSVGELTKLG